MITKQDLLEAIAECQGTRSPNANTAIKLAAFYTILDHLNDSTVNKEETQSEQISLANYSFAGDTVIYNGTSDFAKIINGKSQADVWPIIDELMSTVQVMNPRLYNGVIKKL